MKKAFFSVVLVLLFAVGLCAQTPASEQVVSDRNTLIWSIIFLCAVALITVIVVMVMVVRNRSRYVPVGITEEQLGELVRQVKSGQKFVVRNTTSPNDVIDLVLQHEHLRSLFEGSGTISIPAFMVAEVTVSEGVFATLDCTIHLKRGEHPKIEFAEKPGDLVEWQNRNIVAARIVEERKTGRVA